MKDNDIIKDIAELQLKNSELEIELKVMRGVANSYKAEIERLTEEVKSKYKWENKLDKTIKETESEAIKEFAERLKEELRLYTENNGGFVPSMIDNLVKEMTENDFKE